MNRLTLRSRSVLYGGQYNYFSAALRWNSLQPFQSGRTAGLLRLCPRARIHNEGVKRRNVWKVRDVRSGNELTFFPVQILNTTPHSYCVCVQGHGFTVKASKGEKFGKYVTSTVETSSLAFLFRY